MTDDMFELEENGDDGGEEYPSSVTRHPTVTAKFDTIFDVLSAAPRRYLLYYLFTADSDVVEMETAVNAVYTFEASGTDTDDCTTREEIQIQLRHFHLPQLADAEIVDYDPRHGTIRFTGGPAIEEWVEHARYNELN